MKTICRLLVGLTLSPLISLVGLSEPSAGYRPDYVRISSGSWVQDKNFYVLTVLQSSEIARAELASDAVLAKISVNTTLLDDDIAAARAVLVRRLPSSPVLEALVQKHLRPSGTYQRLSGLSDAQMLGEAWAQAAHGINHIVDQFVRGGEGRAPDVDSPSYDINAPGYRRMILEARQTAAHVDGARVLFFEPALDFALRLLAINRRDEAGRHEPLAFGENRAAMDAMRLTDWSAYPYVSILVYGAAPDDPGVAISEHGRASSAAAAALYKERKAPFIIVSGGYVHPKQTIFSEAVEMKRELMLVHNIPESAILIDPHARHTPSNARNGARILFAGGVPADKPSLSVSRKEHIDTIVSEQFMQRCDGELGYRPVRYGKRISDLAVEFTPLIDSLQIDPLDPLDP
jgi:hypothetical protein